MYFTFNFVIGLSAVVFFLKIVQAASRETLLFELCGMVTPKLDNFCIKTMHGDQLEACVCKVKLPGFP